MINRSVVSMGHTQLLDVIGHVRGRWRLKLALRGALIVGGAALVAILLSAYGLEKLGFSSGPLLTFRVLTYAVVLGLAIRYLVLPLLRRVTDEQVALYLEEHEPSLQAAVVSAVELRDTPGAAPGDLSPALIRRTIELAVERCRDVEDGRRIDQRQIQRFGAAVAGAAVIGIVLVGFSPAFVRHGANALLNPLTSAETATPYRISVEPGNVTIPRGADQQVRAALDGFDSELVELVLRSGADSSFERLQMARADSGFELLVFHIDQATDYFIESNGVRSPVYRIEVADLPYVKSLTLVYHFPAYTGLPPRTVEFGGDIAVLRGTVVEVQATPTIPTQSGKVIADDRAIPITANEEGVLTGSMRVEKDGFYHIEMTAADGSSVNASPAYAIDILTDMPPTISFSKPGRDTRVTPIQEVFVEARAEDDYGVATIEMVYSVNGGEEQVITLYESGKALREVTAGHTLYLEELTLEPGDLVAYHGRVNDNNAVGGSQSAKSDIYFLTVRPFGVEYRQSQQAGGGGGGGGGDQGELSEMQREIISATFNVVRDSALDPQGYAEKLNTIALTQERLRDQVETLAQRMRNRGVTQDTMFKKIAELLPQAASEMEAATAQLRDSKAPDALPPEQRALQFLLRAEAVFREVQVSMGEQQGGGGGGGSPNAEDLADLFELELDKLRNQYETVQRGEREQAQSEVDETLERLKELARRQQQEAERMRRQAQSRQNSGGGGGGQSQRELAEETEEVARQLERLSRETQQPQLMEAARRLQEAADAMRRSAANNRNGNPADASAALDRLDEARRRLERNRSQQLEQQTREALQRAEELARQQREIEAGMNNLNNAGADRAEQARRLIERKEQQLAGVENLERQLDRMASEARTEQREASRELQEAAGSIRDNQLKEKIRFSRALTQPGANPDYTREMERDIGANLDDLRQRIAEAGDALQGQDTQDRSAEALERTRDLVRGMESLEERTRSARDSAERRRLGQRPGQDQPGQQGQGGEQQRQQGQGQQGQQAQGQGQQGQQGQGQGQQGQQGQGGQGQGQQQGQQGQQGQASPGSGQADNQGEGARTETGVYGPGGGGDARGAVFGAGEVRQFRGELRERLAEAQRLREQLSRDGRDVSALDGVIRDMRALDNERVYANPRELERLQTAVVDGLKQFEYTLRRELQGEAKEKLFLSGTDEVPEGYRKLVEEYYRSLGRRSN